MTARHSHRVLFFTVSLSTTGPARALSTLAIGLANGPWETAVCHFDSEECSRGPVRDELVAAGVQIFSLDGRGFLDLGALARLVRLLRRWRPVILHSRLIRADFYARLAGRIVGVPVIITNLSGMYSRHFTSVHGAAGKVLARIDAATLRFAHRIVANAPGVASDFIEHHAALAPRVRVIPNGIDPARFVDGRAHRAATRLELGLTRSDIVAIYVGRLSPDKGVSEAVEAADLLAGSRLSLHWIIVGDGPERARLEAKSSAGAARDRIHFIGWRDDIPRLLAAADVFVFPSYHEGHPNAVLEAMAAGLPVVATAIPGVTELVMENVTGHLVPVRDAERLARAVEALAANSSVRRRMREAAFAATRNRHDLGPVLSAWDALYREALR